MIQEFFADYAADLSRALSRISPGLLEELVHLLESAHTQESHVFLMGNGGSASTASHIVCDLNKSLSFGNRKRFRAICLSDNLPMLMAYANDISYEDVFIEPLKNFLRPADLVIALSASGNSPNVLKAIEYANSQGAHTVGLSGFDGGKLARIVRTAVVTPVHDMQKAEDAHLIILHVAFQILRERSKSGQSP